MNTPEIDLLKIDRGLVTAPAGCGKTHLIADALQTSKLIKPVLVLTHTNAGVAALRARLTQLGVAPQTYKLYTIDGWAIRLIATFPWRSGHDPEILELRNRHVDYPRIRQAASRLLESGEVADVIVSSYERVIVDEYQDCSRRQHAIVRTMTHIVPGCVLGDPMQSIFDFGADRLANWEEEVCASFPPAGQLKTPWRWINTATRPLGEWLLEVRELLIQQKPIDLQGAPEQVQWVRLDGTRDDDARRMNAANIQPVDVGDRVLVIAESKSPPNQRRLASITPGAIMVEAVDLADFVSFAREWAPDKPNGLRSLVGFAQEVMTGLNIPDLRQRVLLARQGTLSARFSTLESAVVSFIDRPSYDAAADVLERMEGENGVRCHRPTVLRALIRALREADVAQGKSFYEAAIRERENNRALGRPLPNRGVGSTLLLKGLESEIAVLLNPEQMNAKNLYVAMTRGSKQLVICSVGPILNPR
jgi:hypothetical protein